MALEISGNTEPYLDYHLRKYLGQLIAGAYALDDVVEDLKRLAVAAATDDPAFYYIIGEGDPIVAADGRELDMDPKRPDAHEPLTPQEIIRALNAKPQWHSVTATASNTTASNQLR